MSTFLTFLRRNRVYALVNLLGLSVALAFVIIIALYAQMEYGRDRWHSKADRLYSLLVDMDGDTNEGSHWGMQQLLREHVPEVEATCAVAYHNAELMLPTQEKEVVNFAAADSTFFRLFDFPLVLGDPDRVLSEPGSAVLVEETARRLFADTDPMGKRVVLNDSVVLTVTGVMRQFNHTYMQQADLMVSIDMVRPLMNMGDYFYDVNSGSYGSCRVYVQGREGTDLMAQLPLMQRVARENVWLFKPSSPWPCTLEMKRLTDLYFMPKDGAEGVSEGDAGLARLLVVAGLVILLFAVLNYVNLTLAQSQFRMREMAMRRLLGAQRWAVVARLMAESVSLCLAALAVAVLLVHLAEPYLSWLISNPSTVSTPGMKAADIPIIQARDIWRPGVLGLILLSALLLGVVAGLAPALYISKVKPIYVLKGQTHPQPLPTKESSWVGRLRNWFFPSLTVRGQGVGLVTIVQHFVTIVFLSLSLVMWLQVRHLIHAPLGYETERLLVVRPRDWSQSDKMRLLAEEMRSLACIDSIAYSNVHPLQGGSNQTETLDDRQVSFQTFSTSEGWLRLMGIPVVADYGTRGPGGVRTFATRRALEAEGRSADERTLRFMQTETQVDGIIADFTLGSILDGRDNPIVVQERPDSRFVGCIMARYQGPLSEVRRQVGERYERVFGMLMEPGNCLAYDQLLRDQFTPQLRILRLVSIFSLVALTVSLLGLLAIATYFIQQRRKEIAIRKVFGSTSAEVLVRLLRRQVWLVLAAALAALPLAWYLADEWLRDYSYRIRLTPWPLLAAVLLCLLFSLLVVLAQSLRAANENPIHALQSE